MSYHSRFFIFLSSFLIVEAKKSLHLFLFLFHLVLLLSYLLIDSRRVQQESKEWQIDYSKYLIQNAERSDIALEQFNHRDLVYFIIYRPDTTELRMASIHYPSRIPSQDNDPERYYRFFNSQVSGYDDRMSDFRIFTSKKNRSIYQVCFRRPNYQLSIPMILWIALFSAHSVLLLIYLLIQYYVIEPIYKLASEATQHAKDRFPKKLSEDKISYIDFIRKSINQLIFAIIQRQEEIGEHEKSRFIFDTSKRITHNISNSLNPIDYHLNNLDEKNSDVQKLKEHFQRIRTQIHHLKQLNSSLLEKEDYELNSIIQLLIQQLAYTKVQFKYTNNSASNGRAFLDPELIHDALYNLMKNAAEALDEFEEKTVYLELRNDINDIYFEIKNEVSANFKLKQSELVEPFSSSKPEGLGIGVSVSKRILELHHADLEYQLKDSFLTCRVRIPK